MRGESNCTKTSHDAETSPCRFPIVDSMTDFKETLAPISRDSLKDRIVSQIKTLMFSKKIRVGQKLPSERVLSGQFKVSRVIVREALKSLEQSGLVEIRTGAAGGAFVVSDLHIPFFYAVYDLMRAGKLTTPHFWEFGEAIEGVGARMATRNVSDQDVERLRALNERLMESRKNPEATCQAVRDFHLVVAEASGNPLITLTMQSLFKMHDIISSKRRYPVKLLKEVHRRHEEIIDALERREADRCEQLMKEAHEKDFVLR